MRRLLEDFAARARLWLRGRRYRVRTDPAEIAYLRSCLKPGQTAVDVGAHKAGYTYWMDRAVGPTGRVLAFEPLPHLAEYLRRIKDVYPLRQTEVIEAALSDTIGEAPLYMPETGYQGPTTLEPQETGHVTFQVKTDTLDEFCARRAVRPIDFIKADVEGYELALFQGAETVLREDKPVLLFECTDFSLGGGQIGRVFPYLEGLGYEGVFFPRGRMRPVSEFRLDVHQKDTTNLDWCMNFVFQPSARPLKARAGSHHAPRECAR